MALPIIKIVQELSRLRGKSIEVQTLMATLGLEKNDRRSLIRFLDGLVIEGFLRSMRRGGYRVQHRLEMVVGSVELHRAGHGFLSPTESFLGEGAKEDFYLSQFRLCGAMDGDTVTALILPENYERRGRKTRRQEALVLDVRRRAQGRVLGRCFRQKDGEFLLHSEPTGLPFVVELQQGRAEPEADLDGQIVVLDIDRYPTAQDRGIGHIAEVFGLAGEPSVDIKMAAYRQGIPTEFDSAVELEAQAVAVAVREEDFDNRVDLRHLPLVTIDGADARDFDDAVALEKLDCGYRLWVAIADVSHYVQPNSELDRAARERGTSVYFPGSCLPMLPEVLSNGICSLNPDVERLVVVVELEFNGNGERTAMKAFPAVMKSHARLTYEQVQLCLDDKGAESAGSVELRLSTMLREMQCLAQRLRLLRSQRGALDFDLPEADIRLTDSGVPHTIGRRTRLESHRLIEEFMLAANEAVASIVLEKRDVGMFRVHDAPDIQSMQSLQQFVAAFNMGFNLVGEGVQSHELLKLLEQAQGTEQEYTINRILLRSMKQARYDAHNHGHFGLASEAYCHFTSPIRRYPDLIQHRIVLKLLAGDYRWPSESLVELAEQATTAERRAMVAERDIVDLRKCQFMEDKVGMRYTGFITSVTAFGFFVELNEFFVEGLVHIRHLGDDYYRYDSENHRLVGQGRRQIFQVGNAITVEVLQVQPEQREIDFVVPTVSVESRGRLGHKKGKSGQGGRRRAKRHNRR